MNRAVLGAVAALMLAAAGLFWWQGRAETEHGAPPPSAPQLAADPDALPGGSAEGMMGAAPPEATEATREQRRFDRVDRNRDQIVSRNEMLSLRASAFRALDADHNNLLTFEEWAVRTSNKFKGADRNGDIKLTRDEFASTKPQPAKKPDCRCTPLVASRKGPASRARPAAVELDDGDILGDSDPTEPEL